MTTSRGNIPSLVPVPNPDRTYATEVFNDAARVPNPPPLVPVVSVVPVTLVDQVNLMTSAIPAPPSSPNRGHMTATEMQLTLQSMEDRGREYRELMNVTFQPGRYVTGGISIPPDVRISGGTEADRNIPIPPIRHSSPWPDLSIFSGVDFRSRESERIRRGLDRMKAKFELDRNSPPPEPSEPPPLDGISLF